MDRILSQGYFASVIMFRIGIAAKHEKKSFAAEPNRRRSVAGKALFRHGLWFSMGNRRTPRVCPRQLHRASAGLPAPVLPT